MRHPGLTDRQKRDAVTLYRQGIPMPVIARRFGCSKSIIQRAIREVDAPTEPRRVR